MILDTNGLSAMADGDDSLWRVLQNANEIDIPAIVLGEFRYGIQQSRNRERYEQWLTIILATSRLLPVDQETAEQYANVREELKRKGRPIPGNDVWIAALARQHVLPVVSKDRHFDFVPRLKRIDW